MEIKYSEIYNWIMGWSKLCKRWLRAGSNTQSQNVSMSTGQEYKQQTNASSHFYYFPTFYFAGRGCRTTPSTLSTTLKAAIQKAQSCWQKLGKRMNVPTVERSSSTTTAWRSTLKACTKLQRSLVTSVESCWKVRRHWPATWRVFMRRQCAIIALNQGVPWPQWIRTI